MPFPAKFLRHTMLWALPSGEVANTSCAWDTPLAGSDIDTAKVDALAAKGLAFWNDIKPAYAPQITYLGSRVQLVGTTGLIEITAERVIAPVAGTGGGNQLPHEVSVVVSLKTSIASRRGRGRMYLPAPAYGSLTTSGRLDFTIRDDIAQAAATYCATDAVNEMVAVVASKTGSLLTPVTQVRVGDVFDSQRRRRDSLIEAYKVNDV